MSIQWLNKNNINEIKSIAFSEFNKDLKSHDSDHLYEKVLGGDKFGNIDLNYGLITSYNKPIGIIGYYLPEVDKNAAWLGWFAIKPEFRRKGYGEKAVIHLIGYLKKRYPFLEVLRAYTDITNIGALKFYKSMGFQQDGAPFKNAVIIDYNLKKGNILNRWNKEPIW